MNCGVPGESQLMNNFVKPQSKHSRPSDEPGGGSKAVIHGWPLVAVANVVMDGSLLAVALTGWQMVTPSNSVSMPVNISCGTKCPARE